MSADVTTPLDLSSPPPPRAPTARTRRFPAQMVGVLGIFKARGTKVFNDIIGKASTVGGGSPTSILPIKCLLSTNKYIYGPFLVNMALPVVSAVLIAAILIPTTLAKRMHEQHVEKTAKKRKAAREAAALGGARATPFVPPPHEPIVDLGGLCNKIPTKIALALKCCRKAASNEYIVNAERKANGMRRHPPRSRACLSFDSSTLYGIPHALLMACKCCRVDTTESEQNAWRAAAAVHAQRPHFAPHRRFIAVMVLVMYSLFPTLVASTTSIFNCTDAIGGKYYLLIDLSVMCYEGYHLLYLAAAVVSIVVYCIGTPVALAALLVVDCCACTKVSSLDQPEAVRSGCAKLFKCKCSCICTRRSSTPWGYRTASIRERFGLLVAGYDTDRGSIVMAWEPLVVMLRKLLVTLAGTLPRDPYVLYARRAALCSAVQPPPAILLTPHSVPRMMPVQSSAPGTFKS